MNSAAVQVRCVGLEKPLNTFIVHIISTAATGPISRLRHPVSPGTRLKQQRVRTEMLYHMQTLRDNPAAATKERDLVVDEANSSVFYALHLLFILGRLSIPVPEGHNASQTGVNASWAFIVAGVEAVDVPMLHDVGELAASIRGG